MRMLNGRLKETMMVFRDTTQDLYRGGNEVDLKTHVRADEKKKHRGANETCILAMGHQMQKARICVDGQTICAAHARRKRFD